MLTLKKKKHTVDTHTLKKKCVLWVFADHTSEDHLLGPCRNVNLSSSRYMDTAGVSDDSFTMTALSKGSRA